jgi:protein phosphatase
MKYRSWGRTDIGNVKKVNEDSYLVDEPLGLYIVADGVGGLEKGEIASQLACKAVLQGIKSGLSLEESVYDAHRSIIGEIKQDKQKQGMATTIVAVLFNENSYNVAWVGDSRVYLWDGELKLLTKDDSYVELLLENGHIGLEDLDTHPDRNVISQALGIERKQISINSNSGTLEQNQVLLLCSDGLYSISKELDIIDSLKATTDIEAITESLVQIAVDKEGKDNITMLSVISDVNSEHVNQVIKPKIFREFDTHTGQVIGGKAVKNQPNTTDSQEDIKEVDPELVDQTAFKDLSEDDLNLLDSAAIQPTNKKQGLKIMVPAILVSILVVIGLVLLKTL